MLAFLDPQFDTFSNAWHDLNVVATESQLLGHQAWDRAAQDGLGTQGGVLLPKGQGPVTHREAKNHLVRPAGPKTYLHVRLQTSPPKNHHLFCFLWLGIDPKYFFGTEQHVTVAQIINKLHVWSD